MTTKKVGLECSKCGARNYTVPAPRGDQRLEIRKFCKHCKMYTLHRETR